MEFPEFIEFLAKESKNNLMPAGIPRSQILDDDLEHKYLLFTGQLYQITPYLDSVRELLEKYEHYEENLFSFYKLLKGNTWIFIKPNKEKLERYREIVKKAYASLKRKIDIGYDFSIDYYSGVIFYDLGSKLFVQYAKEMIKKLKGKRLVTLDPHTTYALKILYKKVDPSFDAEVHHYTDFIPIPDLKDYADHESCYLTRYLKININSNASKPLTSGNEMMCCGGPIEFVSPRLATEIAKIRVDQLLSTGKSKIVVWCPICLSNLSRVNKAEVKDFLELI